MEKHILKLSDVLIPVLIDKLKPFGPQTYKILETIKLAVSGVRGVDVFTDGWPQFTTILAQLTWPKFCEDSLGIFTTDIDSCRKFLLECTAIDWDKKHSFGGIQPSVASVLRDIGLEKGFKYRINGPYVMMHFVTNIMPDTEPLLPPAYHLDTLQPNDSEFVTSHWPYSETDTSDFVRFIIEHFSTICIKDNDGNLVGWYMQQPYGAMGMLHVMEAHRGRGLGKYMAFKLAKTIFSGGQIPYGYVSESNVVSISLHHACGATIVEDAHGENAHMWVIAPDVSQR